VTGGDAVTTNVVIVGGQLVGGWKRRIDKDFVVVDLRLVTSLTTAEERAVRSAAESYGEFLRLPTTLRGDG
jgi:hypothetical protein